MRHVFKAVAQVRRRQVALLVAMALVTAACAGNLSEYQNAATQAGAGQGAIVDPETGELIDAVTGEVIEAGEAFEGGITAGDGETTDGQAGQTGDGQTGVSAASGPSGEAPAGIGSTTGVTKDEIRIGLFYPKTGAAAQLFQKSPDAVNAAFEEAGRIHGRKLVLRTYDEGTQDASTIQAEERRAKDEVFAYLSVLNETNEVLGPLANQHRVPSVFAAMDKNSAQSLRYVFVTTGYFAHGATILPGFIKNYLKAGNKRIGIVWDGTTQSKNAIEAFKAKAKGMGMNVVAEQTIGTFQSSCANEVSNLQAQNVEVVYMQNGIFGAICMLRDGHAVGYKPIWTGVGPNWNLNVVPTAVGKDAADGIRVINAMTTLETPAGRHFSKVMRESGNGDIAEDDIMLFYYALARTAIESLRRTGPDVGREAFVRTYETKMNDFRSGFLPPPHFGPGDRSGPQGFNVTACCSSRNWWYTEQPKWRSKY